MQYCTVYRPCTVEVDVIPTGTTPSRCVLYCTYRTVCFICTYSWVAFGGYCCVLYVSYTKHHVHWLKGRDCLITVYSPAPTKLNRFVCSPLIWIQLVQGSSLQSDRVQGLLFSSCMKEFILKNIPCCGYLSSTSSGNHDQTDRVGFKRHLFEHV